LDKPHNPSGDNASQLKKIHAGSHAINNFSISAICNAIADSIAGTGVSCLPKSSQCGHRRISAA